MEKADGRAGTERSGELFSYVDLQQRVPARHPLRAIRGLVNEALADIGPELEAVYSRIARPSIAPEKLLRTLLLQLFHGICSERQMMERLYFDLSFRWFVGLGIDDRVWDASTFSKNRDRLLDGEIAARFLSAVLARPRVKRLLSTEHFSVDGTLIEAWCSMKSFRPKDEAEADDANIDLAVEAGIKARFGNSGQVCLAAKRFILERPIAEEFTRKFVEAARMLTIGNPLDPSIAMGPMARKDLRDELHSQVEQTIEQGATLLLGGHKVDGPGNFYEATVLADVALGMTAFEQETFGPVAAITIADDVEHAIVLANASGLWSRR